MREISRELELPLAPQAAFDLLISPSAIRVWWSAARAVVMPRPGGLWVAAWGEDEDAPDYVSAARILVFQPPTRLRLGAFEYEARDGGPPFDTKALETDWSVRPVAHGSVLRVVQSGFPDGAEADRFYAACQQGWAATLDGIARFVAAPTG